MVLLTRQGPYFEHYLWVEPKPKLVDPLKVIIPMFRFFDYFHTLRA